MMRTVRILPLYLSDVVLMWRRAGIALGCSRVVCWCLIPVAIQSIVHPSDVVGFVAKLFHYQRPRFPADQALFEGSAVAFLGLIVLGLLLLGITTLVHRRAQMAVVVWPLAVVLIGIIGNGVWWLALGYFDFWGAVIGLVPVFVTVAINELCEKLGADFVFGRGNRPQEFAYGRAAW